MTQNTATQTQKTAMTTATTMEPTQEQIEQLAKLFQKGQTGYQDDWEDLCLDPWTKGLTATRDTLDNFREGARSVWAESSSVDEVDGGLYWDRIQVAKGQQRVALAVLDCGDFRLTYQQ